MSYRPPYSISTHWTTICQIIAEASPEDEIWGIGVDVFDPRTEHTESWRGQNLLGKAPMYVRSKILFERPDLVARPRVQSVATAVATANRLAPLNLPLLASSVRSRTSTPPVDLFGVPDTTANWALQNHLSSSGNPAYTMSPSPFQGGVGRSATRLGHASPWNTSGATRRHVVNGVNLSWYYALPKNGRRGREQK